MADEHTIDDTLANAYFEMLNPEEQEKYRHKSYTWHHESMKSTHSFIDQLLSEKKIELGKVTDDQAVDVVSHYLLDYLHKKIPQANIKDLLGKHAGKMTAKERLQKLRSLGSAYLGMRQDGDGATPMDLMFSRLKSTKSAEELKNFLFEIGRDYFWEKKGLVNYEVGNRYLRAFSDKAPGVIGQYILKHKVFEPYEQIKDKEHLLELLLPHEEETQEVLARLGEAYHTKMGLPDSLMAKDGSKPGGA